MARSRARPGSERTQAAAFAARSDTTARFCRIATVKFALILHRTRDPQVRRELAATLHLVIEIAAHDHPPDGDLAAEPAVEDRLGELRRRQAGDEVRTFAAGLLQPRQQVEVAGARDHARVADVPDHGLQRALLELPEQ